jgi:GT2 family glycosyltransferase
MTLIAHSPATAGTSVVIPNWNGMKWLDAVLGSISRQTRQPLEVIVVDNGSSDRSLEHLALQWPEVKINSWHENRGFAAAANAGFHEAAGEFVAMINTDIELDPDWLERACDALAGAPSAASVATKMVDLGNRNVLYDTGDFLRRDGATEQRGRFRANSQRFDKPGEVFSACAGAALYRRDAVLAVGGFDERLFIYLEDVELGLRLRLAGHTCLYEPCVAAHAGGGSQQALSGGATLWVERNTIAIVARHFPARWLGPVIYRQIAWAAHHIRNGTIGPWLRGLWQGLRLIPEMLRERAAAPAAVVSIDQAVSNRPWRGRLAGGHPDSPE